MPRTYYKGFNGEMKGRNDFQFEVGATYTTDTTDNWVWDGHTPLRLLGVALTNVTHEDTSQLSLFPDEGRERARKLDKATDAINNKFGAATIVRGTSVQSNLEVGRKHRAQMDIKRGGK